ncbi:MAG: peptidoglycan-binding domain-containing protein, partial [Acutalibacteraceae bacterium]|nr:peptidoglycan-binding domain-containing protein [Acutalibacteraceae bacterium]
KGDKSDGVLAYKSMLITAKTLGLITQSVNADNVFGDGTLKATKQVQTKYKLEVDGIAGVKTITALHNVINKELADIKNSIINSTIDYLEKELT